MKSGTVGVNMGDRGTIDVVMVLDKSTSCEKKVRVSLLMPYIGQPPLEAMALPTQFINVNPILEPCHVLQERIVLKNNQEIPQVLVQW